MINNNITETVMLVDDTPANLKVLSTMLRERGYRVVEFPNGPAALRALSRNQPDLILLDIMMPEMDGFEVCRQIKADRMLKNIPVIFISALGEEEHKLRAFSGGGVDYVTKPFHEEETLARVQTHLRLRSMQKELETHNLHLEDLVREKVKEISASQVATIQAVSGLAECRDDVTGRHIERTSKFCKMLAGQLMEQSTRSMGIRETFADDIYHAAPLHDIGKVGISDAILLKPGKLSAEEFETIKKHTLIGAMTLEKVRSKYPQNAFINMGIALTRSHHERWDGGGYPDGLAGEEIPISARIMALADVYDALRSERPYKGRLSHRESVAFIRKENGKHFDPSITEAFISSHGDFEETSELLRDVSA